MKTYAFVSTGVLGGTISLSEFRRSQQATYVLGRLYLELLNERTWSEEYHGHIHHVSLSESLLVITGPGLPKDGIKLSSKEVKTIEDVHSHVLGVHRLLREVLADCELTPGFSFEVTCDVMRGETIVAKGTGLPSGGLIMTFASVSTLEQVRATIKACILQNAHLYLAPAQG